MSNLPQLHFGIENFPWDANVPGHLSPTDDIALDSVTRLFGIYWHTHTYEPLTRLTTLQEFFDIDGEDTHIRPNKALELRELLDYHADIVLDRWSLRYQQTAPSGPLVIYLDNEAGTIEGSREPYIETEGMPAGIGIADQIMFAWLCARVETRARFRRGWSVACSVVRPIRPTGLIHARPGSPWLEEMPSDFRAIWRGANFKRIIRPSVTWSTVFIPHTLDGGETATHESYAYRQVRHMAVELADAQILPREITFTHWIGNAPLASAMEGIFTGLKNGFADFRTQLPRKINVMVTGDWQVLKGLGHPDVVRTDQTGQGVMPPVPPTLSINAVEARRAIVAGWNERVAAPWREVMLGQAPGGEG